MNDLVPKDKNGRRKKIYSFLFIALSFVVFHGVLTLERQFKMYTLYGSSGGDDRFQDMYVASFELGEASRSKEFCGRTKSQLLEAHSSSMSYECRRGPYAPYKFMVARAFLDDPKASFWRMMPQ